MRERREWITDDGYRAGVLALAIVQLVFALADLAAGQSYIDSLSIGLATFMWWWTLRENNDLRGRLRGRR